MHRAEKASSKLCRDREVEKAQEFHRRKIDAVKSYLTSITRPPAPPVPPNKVIRESKFFRRRFRQPPHGSQPSQADASKSTPALSADEGTQADYEDNSYSDDGEEENGETSPDKDTPPDENASNSFGKLDELRSVLVPVMAYKGARSRTGRLDYEGYLDEITNPRSPQNEPPPKPQIQLHQSTHSLRASAFRLRRLKQIEADNVTLFGRIKNTPAHYRAEHFKKEWDQNVAYLTSICEFPVAEESIQVPPPRRHTHTRKRSPFARPLEQLPSLQFDSPPTIHPIKAIPTSHQRVKPLDLSPAFRSLRKGLPQVPALPPFTASPRTALSMKHKSMTAIAGCRSAVVIDPKSHVQYLMGSPRPEHQSSIPSQRAERVSEEDTAAELSRYMLLKVGRFIGGRYLILTVFCGHGITNPYGFDVLAVDPETKVEFQLSITKETTHLLLETISSSTMAERTAAAAGTNLSMELIARCICDHVRYACLDSCEMVFLVATVGTPGGLNGDTAVSEEEQPHGSTQVHTSDNATLLVDVKYSAMAICLHQYVQISKNEDDRPRHFHVFASTRPQQCCQASMADCYPLALSGQSSPSVDRDATEFNGLVSYQLRDELNMDVECGQLLLSVNELIHQFEAARVAVESEPSQRLSLDRMLMLSLQYIHVIQEDDGHPHLALSTSQPNDWISQSKSPSRAACPALPSSSHHLRTQAHDDVKTILQTGMLWRGAYLFTRATLLCPATIDEATGDSSRDPTDEMLVIDVFNASTGRVSEKALNGDHVDKFSQKLGPWQSSVGSVPPLVVFVKLLLLRMRLEVNRRGHEVIVFPTIEPKYRNAGNGGSPLAVSRRSSPKKNDNEATLEYPSATEPNSLERELQAVIEIQAISRGFLSRLKKRRQTATQARSSHPSLVGITLPDVVLAFIKKRAAKRIQAACRDYADRIVRRKRAQHDLGGLSIKTPRSLTPTTATGSSRAGGGVGARHLDSPTNEVSFLYGTAGREGRLTNDSNGDVASEDDEEDSDEDDQRPRRVDMLGSLEEQDCEDEQEQQIDLVPSETNPGDTTSSNSREQTATASIERSGRKASVGFVLLKRTSSNGAAVDSRIIGLHRELRSETEPRGF